jgi:transcriptional regulator with XRE-family HTH domain
MTTKTDLPGIDAAQEVLGLTIEEIAQAVRANPSTLYRWREGGTPSQGFLDRLMRLEDLAAAIQQAFKGQDVARWLNAPTRVFQGKSPPRDDLRRTQ